MQRILSLETSRSSNLTSEFVTKRLCCSFILTVAFFAVIGGFFLGRFATDRTLHRVKMEIEDLSRKLTALDSNLKQTFHDSLNNTNCSTFTSRISCEHFKLTLPLPDDSYKRSLQELQILVDVLNTCFNYG